ncbi:putative ribose-phosphate pyrophosphokinase 2 [Microbulbifer aestuariivivens]|uniref:Ribose-phosphate pyrophosphokinase 2 n=1 Tax=Microbulbifer aestuariivivens TaxID=1908308 RepID=A0ABP9WTD1_9GAMM
MKPILIPLQSDLPLFQHLCTALDAEAGELERRRFPDGESYLRVHSAVAAKPCIVLANLSDPDANIPALLFLADTLRELGATSVGVVAPYLCYMRQDRRFHTGEAVTAPSFARLLSRYFDWLVCVDPHLHRIHRLQEVYSIPAVALSAAPLLASWIAARDEPCLLVGPDAESRQWVSALARQSGQPMIVGEKQRLGDREVRISLPALSQYCGHSAVLVDDVISSGHTALEALHRLREAGFARIDCLAVHGLFAEGAAEKLRRAGVRHLLASNSLAGADNRLDLSPLLAPAIHELLNRSRSGRENSQ